MSGRFDHDPMFAGSIRKPEPPGFRILKSLGCMVLIVLVLQCFLFLLSDLFRGGGREAARRAQCVNNLKQIALAMHNYVSDHGALPPACTVDPSGRRLHSWRTLLLPYLEQKALFDSIDLSRPWDDPVNAKALAAIPYVYRCPSSTAPRNATTYLANAAEGGCLIPGKHRRFAEISDPTGATILDIEVDDGHAVPWMAPIDADESLILGLSAGSKPNHIWGFNAGMVDGSVKFLKVTLPATVRRALISIAGGDGPKAEEF
ncbi:DUF1559 domain-containing protein [Aquisphaera insulae]|uniref:DUF1559 domain-containing protein n=1 Tax=Aquisphaera insulae TaxID=2712864 RepID=UPI00203026A9|nr:DUF1559 domain-containing protein [Aquisphaera insulae]